MCDNLYSSLSYNIPSYDLNVEEKEELCGMIEGIDKEKLEIIYLLILYHHYKTNSQSKVVFPYKIKQTGNIIEIKVDCLPLRLKQILYKFLKLIYTEQEKQINVKKNTRLNTKRRGRKPKYLHTLMLKNIDAREIYRKNKLHKLDEQIEHQQQLLNDTPTIFEYPTNDQSQQPTNNTKLTDIIPINKAPVFLENNITRHVQMIDHIDYGCLPSRTDIYCWHDKHDFTTSPIGIPIDYIPRKEDSVSIKGGENQGTEDYYLTYGIFCSFPCALAYIEEYSKDTLFKNSKSLLYSLYYKLYGVEMNIKKAPSWQFLQNFGGELNIDEFREAYCQANFVITGNIKRPYMVAVGKYTEQKKCGCL